MYFFDNTYQQQTQEVPKLTTQPLPKVGLKPVDTAASLEIKRTQLNVIDIDHSIPVRFRQVKAINTITPEVITAQDSLRFNLKGKTGVHTNWDIKLQPNINQFNETAFSHFDSELIIASREKSEDLALGSDSLAQTSFEIVDTIPAIQPELYTEKGEVIPEPIVIPKPPLREDWFLVVMTISLLIAGLVRLNWGNYLKNMIQSIVFSNAMSKLEGSNVSNIYPSLVLGFLFYLNTSIFVFEILMQSGRQFMGFDSFFVIPMILVFLLVLFSLKILVYRVVGHIFETIGPVRDYLFGSSTMAKAYGILIIPFIVFIPFIDENAQLMLVKFGLGLFILLYLMQIARGVRIILSNTFSVYYIILYLCALEILPLTILFKVIFR
jgi:hypothetical protein